MLSPSAHPSGFIEPCLPTLSRTVPDGPRWAFEVKHDGYRFIARRDGDRVRVFSRHGKDWTDKVAGDRRGDAGAVGAAMVGMPLS
jgi:bifunctional non-homologous end joining protein LigD